MKQFLLIISLVLTSTTFARTANTELDTCKVEVPNAFSPNGDRVHDGFVIKSNCSLESYKLTVFDRWGNAVFETDDILTHWDGEDMPVGVYFWTLEGKYSNGSSLKENGNVSLMR